jgi:hypothetical protein
MLFTNPAGSNCAGPKTALPPTQSLADQSKITIFEVEPPDNPTLSIEKSPCKKNLGLLPISSPGNIHDLNFGNLSLEWIAAIDLPIVSINRSGDMFLLRISRKGVKP